MSNIYLYARYWRGSLNVASMRTFSSFNAVQKHAKKIKEKIFYRIYEYDVDENTEPRLIKLDDNFEQQKNKKLCSSCQKNPASKLQNCIYDEEINPESIRRCNCCADCRNECAMDI